MTNETHRAEAWQQSYADRAAVVSIEVRRRKAAEAELRTERAEHAVLKLYVGVLEAMLDAANERADDAKAVEAVREKQRERTRYEGLPPEGLAA